MKKTLLRTLISTAIVLALPIGLISASAAAGEPITAPGTNSSNITLTINDSYSVVIPTSYTLTDSAFAPQTTAGQSYEILTGEVYVENPAIPIGTTLNVKFGTDGQTYQLVSDGDNPTTPAQPAPFTICSSATDISQPIAFGTTKLTCPQGTATRVTEACNVAVDKNDLTSGIWSGSLDFTVSVDATV